MPQMAPIMWSVLLALFYSILLMFMVKLYFYSKETSPNQALLHSGSSESAWPW